MSLTFLTRLAAQIRAQGGRLWLTGGQVRDGLAQDRLAPRLAANGNFDLVAFGLDPLQILEAAAPFGPARLLVGRRGRGQNAPDLILLKVGPSLLEIAPARDPGQPFGPSKEAGPAQDALTRDFTVNAIYYDPLAKVVLDPLGGLSDLKAKRLAPCSPVSLAQDPLRILRAMVLTSRRGFVATGALLAGTARSWPRLKSVAPSRLWPEWAKWSRSRWPHLGLYFLKDSGALRFFPELMALIGTPQNRRFHPEGDAFNHTALVVQALSELPLPDQGRRGLLTLAALLHDVGKPRALTFNARGNPVTSGHASIGVPLAKDFLRAQRAPEKIVAAVSKLVRWHMELSFKALTAHDLWSVARKLAPECDLADLWALQSADWNGRRPRIEIFPHGLEDYLAPVGGARAPRKPLLGGQDIIAALQISPGPDVGRILKNLVRAHDLGVVGTPEEALDWLRLLGGGEGGRDR